jgi:xylan 1,4-beta-xylosidase
LTWAFEFEDQPYFAGFRSLASNGIDKPVLNVFRMFAKMRGHRIPAQSSGAIALDEIVRRGVRAQPDVGALASLEPNKLSIMVWHYHDDDLPGPEAVVELAVNNLPLISGEAKVEHFRIDENHSNAFTAWKKMGSPQRPTAAQYAQLEKAGQLSTLSPDGRVPVENEEAHFTLRLPRQAVSLLQFTW